MRKKVFMHIWVLIVVVGILLIANSNTAKAASKLEIKVNGSTTIRLTEWKVLDISVYYNGQDVTEMATISCSSSKPSILDVGDSSGSWLVLDPKRAGKSTVTITAEYLRPSYWDNEKNEYVSEIRTQGQTQCTINIQYFNSVRAQTCLMDYNTRNNTFIIKVKNLSNKKITILSKGAKALDCDYKKYDRKLRIKGKSKVVINPGQTKKISFKVIGKRTWYDHEDFEIRSYWKWGKKKYLVSVDSFEETRVKSGKKWKLIGCVDTGEEWSN